MPVIHYDETMNGGNSSEYPERERLRDLLFAYPEGCEETVTTPIDRMDYLLTRREWMQNTVRTCGRLGLTLASPIFHVAFMSNERLQNLRKPKDIVTWFDCGESLSLEVMRYIEQSRS